MSDLDKKLVKLLDSSGTIKHCCGQSGCNDIADDIKQIKQAFKDAGWMRVRHSAARPYKNIVASDGPIMTGQEWYDRFKKELAINPNISKVPVTVLKAAKKAAGIE